MGFDYFDIVHFLDEAKSVEEMVEVLTGSKHARVPSNALSCLEDLLVKGFSKFDSAKILLRNNFDVAGAAKQLTAVAESFKKHSEAIEENFFLKFFEFLAERFRHYRKYCVACHAPHNCQAMEAVVCAKPLCVFRWEEFNLDNIIPAHQCVFENCGSTNWAKKCIEYFGESVEAVSKKYGISQKTVLEMAFHRYLERDEMMKFFAVIKQLNVKAVKNCLSPELCVRYVNLHVVFLILTSDLCLGLRSS